MTEATTTALDPHTIDLYDLVLPVRTEAKLTRGNVIHTVGQLIGYYDDELIAYFGLTEEDLDNVQDKLRPLGFSIKF